MRLALALWLLLPMLHDAAPPGWQLAPPMLAPATAHVAVLLHDGTVLVMGGEPDTDSWPVPWTQRYYPSLRQWHYMPDMHAGRIAETATVLPDGRVLVAGGLGPHWRPLASMETFDPGTNRWTLLPPLPQTRFSQSASLLPDGSVLLVGGIVAGHISRSTVLVDPVTGRSVPGPSTAFPHAQQATVTMYDGRVLIAGGYGGGPEVYDPARRAWSGAGSEPARTHPVMTVLDDGSVLMASGRGNDSDPRVSAVFNPASATWERAAALHTGRDAAVGALLPDGDVLLAGGEQMHPRVLRSVELFDPAAGTWRAAPALHFARDAATATILLSGQVLVCGGMNFSGVLRSCELYTG